MPLSSLSDLYAQYRPPTEQPPTQSSPPAPTSPPPTSPADIMPFPSELPPAAEPQTLPDLTDAPPSPGFGPQVPDTTQDVTAQEAPGALFTAENMGAEDSAGFLQSYADLAPGVQPEETVQGQLENVLNKDNALFDWARGQAAQYSNSRGLINSDIAAEASAQAVMGVALPIAAADAQVYAERAVQERQFWYTAGLQAFDATIQSGLMAQDHLQRIVQMSHQGDINSRLQLEQFGYNWNLNEQQNLHNMQLAAMQGDIAAGLALQQFGFDTDLMTQDHGFRLTLADTELRNALTLSGQDHEEFLEAQAQGHANTLDEIAAQGEVTGDLADQEFSRNLQQNYLNAVERRTLQFSAEVTSIYSQEGLTASQQQNAVNIARNNMENDLKMLAQQYSSSPGWDPNWSVSGSSVATPGNPNPVPSPTGLPAPLPDVGGPGTIDIGGVPTDVVPAGGTPTPTPEPTQPTAPPIATATPTPIANVDAYGKNLRNIYSQYA